MFLLNIRITNFILLQLDFESYFIKLISIQSYISLHSSAHLVLRLAPKPRETFAHDVSCAFKTMMPTFECGWISFVFGHGGCMINY